VSARPRSNAPAHAVGERASAPRAEGFARAAGDRMVLSPLRPDGAGRLRGRPRIAGAFAPPLRLTGAAKHLSAVVRHLQPPTEHSERPGPPTPATAQRLGHRGGPGMSRTSAHGFAVRTGCTVVPSPASEMVTSRQKRVTARMRLHRQVVSRVNSAEVLRSASTRASVAVSFSVNFASWSRSSSTGSSSFSEFASIALGRWRG
jgi:hypothetical protein